MTDIRMTLEPVLVTGATGQQGGAVARALLAGGTPVRALVRDAGAARAKALAALGANLVIGDLNDSASLLAAATGVRGVFSVQAPDIADLTSGSDRVQGKNLVDAATAAGVPQFVHSSVSGAGDYHRHAPGWAEGRWTGYTEHYWESKAYTEELVRAAGFTSWTIIKPPGFMENYTPPSFLFGNWVDDGFVTAYAAETRLPLVAVQDIGAAGAAIFNDPETFNKVDLELAGDDLTMTEVARVLSEVLGREIAAPVLSPADALARGLMPAIVTLQEWFNDVGSPARPEYARALGLTPINFKTWATKTLRLALRENA